MTKLSKQIEDLTKKITCYIRQIPQLIAGDNITLDKDGNEITIHSTGTVGPPGPGDMDKTVYDTNDNGIVDNSELVNGLTVETAVPPGAVFTDTQVTYTDAEIKTKAENNADTNFVTDAQLADIAIIPTKLDDVIAGANITIDKTDPNNPIIHGSAGGGGGIGDMLKITYDPNLVNGDAFDMNNMIESPSSKILTSAERDKLNNISITQAVDLDQIEIDTNTNNNKVGITAQQTLDITDNNNKISFPEAPDDNQEYTRKNNGWVIASAAGGGAVSSVNSLTGAVVLDTSNIAENTNLYYTEARVSANTDVVANSNKIGITAQQATDITTNNAKMNSVVAGSGISLDVTDPLNPIINSTGGSGNTNLTYTPATRLLESDTGTDVILPEVIASGDSGLMNGIDKQKLDDIYNVNISSDITASTYTLLSTDGGDNKVLSLNSATSQTITIDNGVHSIGDVITLWRGGIGSVEIIAGVGVTFEGIDDGAGDYFINDQYSFVTLIAESPSLFKISGNLTTLNVGGNTNLSNTPSPVGTTIESDSGTNTTLPLSDAVNSGEMSPTDFIKLRDVYNVNILADETSAIYNLIASDGGDNKQKTFSSSSPQTVSVANNIYSTGDVINLWRSGTGAVEIVAGIGVVFEGVDNGSGQYFINDQHSPVVLICETPSLFRITGNLTVQGGTNNQEVFEYAFSDESSPLTVGISKITFRIPYACTLDDIRVSLNTAPTGSVATFDLNEEGVSILSTKITIDDTEKTSVTATTPFVISDANLADDAEMTVDIDTIGSTVAGAGGKLKIYITKV